MPGKAYQPAGRRDDTDATCESAPTAGRMADVYATLARVGPWATMAYLSNGGNRTQHNANVCDMAQTWALRLLLALTSRGLDVQDAG